MRRDSREPKTSVPHTLTRLVRAARRKNKFCDRCRGRNGQNIMLPIDRIRGLPPTLDDIVVNSAEGGVWSVAPAVLSDSRFRVVNNTAVRHARREPRALPARARAPHRGAFARRPFFF